MGLCGSKKVAVYELEENDEISPSNKTSSSSSTKKPPHTTIDGLSDLEMVRSPLDFVPNGNERLDRHQGLSKSPFLTPSRIAFFHEQAREVDGAPKMSADDMKAAKRWEAQAIADDDLVHDDVMNEDDGPASTSLHPDAADVPDATEVLKGYSKTLKQKKVKKLPSQNKTLFFHTPES